MDHKHKISVAQRNI